MMGESVDLEANIAKSQLVITGEGKFDSQTAAGKVVSHVQELCAKHGVPCVVICGVNESGSTVNVFDLVSRFPVKTCMSDALCCLSTVVRENMHSFPVLKSL